MWVPSVIQPVTNVVCLAVWKNALYGLLILCDFGQMSAEMPLLFRITLMFCFSFSFFFNMAGKQVVTSLLPTAAVINYCSVLCLENTDFYYCRVDFSAQQWQGWQIQVVWKLSLIL